MGWLSENGLALYGAITGSAALVVSYFGHRHNVQKDTIKLAVSVAPHPRQLENIENMRSTEGAEDWDRANLVEVFQVTVRNVGSIPAPLEDVGVITELGVKEHALLPHRNGSRLMLYRVEKSNLDAMAPRSAQTFSIYLTREQPMFTAVEAYAVDQTGKKWSSRS